MHRLQKLIDAVVRALKKRRTVFLFGNGGSAAQAQHLAAELEGKFYRDRRALPVRALTTNSSTITAVGNDLGFDSVFARQIEAHARKGDVAIALSTSGRSKNVLEGARAARAAGAVTAGLTGRGGGDLKKLVDIWIPVPSDDVARIQECHLTIGHVLCEVVERELA